MAFTWDKFGNEMFNMLRVAHLYLSHDEVQSIPFCVSAKHQSDRVQELLSKIEAAQVETIVSQQEPQGD